MVNSESIFWSPCWSTQLYRLHLCSMLKLGLQCNQSTREHGSQIEPNRKSMPSLSLLCLLVKSSAYASMHWSWTFTLQPQALLALHHVARPTRYRGVTQLKAFWTPTAYRAVHNIRVPLQHWMATPWLRANLWLYHVHASSSMQSCKMLLPLRQQQWVRIIRGIYLRSPSIEARSKALIVLSVNCNVCHVIWSDVRVDV